jgi:protein TonB
MLTIRLILSATFSTDRLRVMSAAAAILSRASERSGIGVAILATHALLIYGLCSWAPIRAAFEQTPIEASLIDAPAPDPLAPPPPEPKIVSVELPAMEPPLITITDEPAPNAITVARVDQPAPPPPPIEAAPRIVTEVAYLEPPAPKYPPESRRSGEEGLVVLKVLINETGRAARVDVERSSGYARLDAAARAAVERALFRPYVENGVPHMALAMIPVEFTWKSRSAGRAGRS